MRYLFLRVDGFILNMLASGAFMLRFASRIVCGPGVGDGAVGVGCLLFFYFRGIVTALAGLVSRPPMFCTSGVFGCVINIGVAFGLLICFCRIKDVRALCAADTGIIVGHGVGASSIGGFICIGHFFLTIDMVGFCSFVSTIATFLPVLATGFFIPKATIFVGTSTQVRNTIIGICANVNRTVVFVGKFIFNK